MEFLKFTVDSALLQELGEKLVETVHLALVELVKNSYDADATKVEIIFNDSEIKILDDGIGMNYDAVQNYWMRIATNIKTRDNTSPVYGRPRTGAKGIGRFCCRRLGGKLKLITNGTETGKLRGRQRVVEKTTVEFPWTSFKPGTDVTEVKCPGEQTRVTNEATGTTLIISELTDNEWTKRGFAWLKRQLAVLAANRGVKREGYDDDPGFEIILVAPDFEGGVKDIRDDLINAGWGTLKAHINKNQAAVCELDALEIGTKTITSTQSFPHLNDISLKLGIMVDDRIQIRDTSIISKTTLKDILKEWGGVQIRYNGFRVPPYGDDDWLNIDRDRGIRKGLPNKELHAFAQTLKGVDPGRALLSLTSMRSYIGNVEIGENASGFEMKASRDGFLFSPAFTELKDFVRYAIDWATIYRDFYLRSKIKEESDTALSKFEEIFNQKVEPDKIVYSAIHYIKKEVKRLVQNVPRGERNQVEKSIAKATEAIQKHEQFNKDELSHLRLIASTSTLLLIFSHEVRSLLGMLEFSKNSLRNIEIKLSGEHGESIKQITGRLEELKDRFEDLLGLTSKIGIDSRSAKPAQIALREKIIESEKAFQLIINSYDIKIDYREVPRDIVVNNFIEAEIYAILLNVLSNSIKSVIAADGDCRIQIIAYREKGKTILLIRDNGVGIDPCNYDEVFIPFIADPEGNLYSELERTLNPEDKYIVGTGSGLGLSIVREIVKNRNGSISFRNPQVGWSAELEIVLS